MPIDPNGEVWAASGRRAAGSLGDLSTPSGLLRTWARAIRVPWLAAVSAAGSALVIVQLLRIAVGSIEEASIVVSLLLVFAVPTLITTLPQSTVQWRVASLLVGLHLGPVLATPMEQVSVGAFLDSFGAAFSGDGTGLLYIVVCAGLALPLLEAVGAWVRRGALAVEAERVGRPRGPSWRLPTT